MSRDARPPETDAASRYVDGSYLTRNPDWHESDAPWKAEQVWSMLADHRLAPKSICDVGCGTGGVLEQLSLRLPPDTLLVGYDISRAALALAPESRRRRVTIRGEDPRTATERFDLVLVLDVFEHVSDYIGFLHDIRARGEAFIFHIPLDMSVQHVLRMKPILRKREEVGHLHYFSRETALATLDDAGYRILDERFTPGSLTAPNRRLKTRLYAIPRRLAARLDENLAARVLGGFSLMVLARPEC